MSLLSKIQIYVAVLCMGGALSFQAVPEVAAQGFSVYESLVSLVHPGETQDAEPKGGEEIERLLLGRPLVPTGHGKARQQGKNSIRVQNVDVSSGRTQDIEVFLGWGELLPGFRSIWPMRERLIGEMQFNSGRSLPRSRGQWLSECGQGVVSFVSLAEREEDPLGSFSSFEIRVNRAKFHVELLAEKFDGSKTLLFQCKAGLGSAEYQTPRGSFYVMRIFDDHPLWIPPPDRDWAWGQSPSRSVYGGHMMPLFSKRPANSAKKSEAVVRDLDQVAPEMEVVDLGFYRIHGTDSPWSVGSAQSHGCVRLLNASVAILADRLKEYVGMGPRGENPNGRYVELARPVKVTLY